MNLFILGSSPTAENAEGTVNEQYLCWSGLTVGRCLAVYQSGGDCSVETSENAGGVLQSKRKDIVVMVPILSGCSRSFKLLDDIGILEKAIDAD